MIMAEYRAKLSSGTTYKGDFKIKWATATQEELAYAYEDLGMTSLVEKLSTTKTKDEPKKATKKKKSGKESSDSKE
jgi:isocitrate lyase